MKSFTIAGIVTLAAAVAVAAGIAALPENNVKAAEGDVAICEENFPDEYFRGWLLEQTYGQDTIISKNEISGITQIKIQNKKLRSLEGIEYFTELKELICDSNKLEKLDVSSNTKLEKLDCGSNEITSLNLSGCKALKSLRCSENKLESIDVSECTALVSLNLHHNLIKSIDVSKNLDLEILYCPGPWTMNSLDVTNNVALKELHCTSHHLTSLDVSNNINLIRLDVWLNDLTELNLENNIALKSLHVGGNDLTSLDVSKNANLSTLYCWSNKLEQLDVSSNSSLKYLYCDSNQLTNLDLSFNENLVTLQCNRNKLESLDVSENTKLTELKCTDNPLTKLYIPSSDSLAVECDEEDEKVVLTPSDWNYTGAEWKDNKSDPAKTTAFAKFQCIKEGEEDYICSRPMTVEKLYHKKSSCTESGKAEYEATITAFRSRTKEEINEEKTFDYPLAAHKWSSWQSTKKASVGAAAVETRSCTVCKSSETRNPEAILICGKKLSLPDTLKGMSSVTWKSSDTKIATVDSKGKITAKMAGKVTISATASGRTEKCVVTVLYKDVTNTGDFWYAPTNYLTAKGVVKGYANQTEFRPANDCTRAQMVTFLYRLQGEPKTKSNKCKFDDVKSGDYFYKPVIWAVENGITTGISKEKFDPQGSCTRAQTVTFLWRMANKPEPKSTTCKFTDVKKDNYFYKAAIWASEKKILAGYDDNTFRPQGKCLRRQMVTFLYKYDKYVNGKG